MYSFSRRLTKLLGAMCFTRESSFLVSCQTCDQTTSGVLLNIWRWVYATGRGIRVYGVPCLFMITEVSIRCQKKPGCWCTAYTPQYTTAYNIVMLFWVFAAVAQVMQALALVVNLVC